MGRVAGVKVNELADELVEVDFEKLLFIAVAAFFCAALAATTSACIMTGLF